MGMINLALYPRPNPAKPAGQRLTVATAATSVVTALHAQTDAVLVDVQTDDIFMTIDGTTPSSSNGHRLYAKSIYVWNRALVDQGKFIRANANCSIQISELSI